MSSPVSLSWRGAVGVVTIDNPPVNAINHAVRVGLVAALGEIAKNVAARAVVIAAAGRTFMAGSDIKEFDAPLRAPGLPEVIQRIEAFHLPVVAAIHGTALGGGFEIALGCHARIAAADAKVGLPEIHLGLIPGAGGTQRLPRLIGLEKALDWILLGRHVRAAEAKAAGAVDEIAHQEVVEAAIAYAGTAAIRRTRDLTVQAAPAVLDAQRQAVVRRARGFDAPLAAIDAVAAAALPFDDGITFERETSARLKASDQSRAQRHLFFAEREVARVPDIPKDTPLRPISVVGIVGAGTMGRGIVVACLNAGLRVVWVDRTEDLTAKGVAAVRGIFARDLEKQRLTDSDLNDRMGRLSAAADIASLASADLVIEAAFEDMAIKQGLFRQLDKVCKPGAILASNTSTLNLNRIAEVTARPGDVVGMHFFSPAHVMKLLEVVRGGASAPDAVATAMSFGKRIGKIAVLSGVCFGFIGNRMFEGYIRESQMLLLEGATPAQVDRALTDFGMAMGPCAVIDLAGVDVSYLTREGNRANLPKDPRYCAVGDALHRLGRHGQKTGKGFYRYADGKTLDDPEVEALIRAEAQRLGVKQRVISAEEITARCIYPLIDEGLRILDEKIALGAADIDVVWTAGYGFPRYRGGPMFHADLIGLKTVAEGMARFADILGDEFGYWTPCAPLATLVAAGKSIRSWSAR